MQRTKIVVTLLAVGVSLIVGLGARAMPMSELQDWCTGAGGDWDGWVEFGDEEVDGELQPIEFGTCTWYTGTGGYDPSGDRYVQVYRDGERQRSCTYHDGQSYCDYGKGAPSPTPSSTPTPTPISNPRVGGTSGTYQQPTSTPTPTPSTRTTTTTTTSGTNTR